MKFLVKQLGWDAFEKLVQESLAEVRREGVPPLPFDAQAPGEVEAAPTTRAPRPNVDALRELVRTARWDEPRPPAPPPLRLTLADAEARWRRSNVRPQRQPDHSIVTVTLPLGDVSGAHLRALASLAESYGDGTLRTTHGQDVTIRWVRNEDVGALYAALAAIELHRGDVDTLADVTSCPGAESCKLAVTRSRGVAGLVNEHFASRLAELDRIGALDVRVSGCPNGCGLHHVAGIGLQGGLRKVDGRPAPQYFVYLGGDAAKGRFGKLSAKVPARRIGVALERLSAMYVAEREANETAADFFARVPIPQVKTLLADLEPLTSADARPEDFVDLGDTAAFRGETSEGECAS
jgi:sulfite reductase (NADPH) hemoprotein beta-component